MKKYELTEEFITNTFGKKLYRIRALVDFDNVKAGEIGGYIESEENLDQSGNAWVSGNARVSGNAWVFGNARVSNNARVYGEARVSDNAWVSGEARVSNNAWVFGNARVYGEARVSNNAWVCGNARVSGNADYATAKGFGSRYRTTTFFREEDGGIGVRCGCFYGTLEEFRKKVKETHGDSKMAKEYLMLADLMEYRFLGDGGKIDGKS